MTTTQQPDGYLATPTNPNGRGVLVLHAWWGLNATMRDVCDRLAEAGYMAFAPDLYHGTVVDTIEAADARSDALSVNRVQAQAEIAEAVRYLAGLVDDQGRHLAVIGFSLGGWLAVEAVAADPQYFRKVVLFYGMGNADFTQIEASFLGHFAATDPYEPAENVAWLEGELRKAGRELDFYTYEGTGHWFFEPDRTDAYNSAAAQLAWQRTLAFLRG